MEQSLEPFFVFLLDESTGQPYQPEGVTQVFSLSWRALGGCERAELLVSGLPQSLELWQDWLGKAVLIRNAYGSLVWWGYVQALSKKNGEVDQVCTLADVANRVAVAYTSLNPNGAQYGEAMLTDWAEDAASEALYGRKELLYTRGMMAENAALQLRAQMLRQRAYPGIRLQPRHGQLASEKRKEHEAEPLLVQCYGWAERLGWRYYQAPPSVLGNAAAQQGNQSLGNSSSYFKVAQSFLVSSTAFTPNQLQVRARRNGSPNDVLRVAIQADNGSGVPNGIDLVSAQVSGADLAAEAYPWVKFTFNDAPQLNSGSVYWAVFSRTSATSSSNYYLLGMDEKLSFEEGTFKTYNGSAWSARSPQADLVFKLSSAIETNELLADALAGLQGEPYRQVSIQFQSGIYTVPLSERPKLIRQIVNEVLELGTADDVPITYTVTPQRELIFSLRPSSEEILPYQLSAEGAILDPGGERLLPGVLPVGCWLQAGGNGVMYITHGKVQAPDWLPKLRSE